MHRPPRRPSSGSNVRLPAVCLLLCAAAVLICGRLGGENLVQTMLQQLTQNTAFLRSAIALETGFYDDPVPTVLPASAVHATVTSEDAAESSYVPSAADAAKSQPIESTTAAATGNVQINNATDYTYSIPAMLQHPVRIRVTSKTAPQVLLIHTHSTEAYTQDAQNTYVSSETSESQRTLDKTKSVIRVGDEMQKVLEARGIRVIHCREVFDNPSYNGSYGRALSAIEAQLKKTPSIQVVIDVHRDSIASASGAICKTLCKVDGKTMAQAMLVMGTDASGLPNDHWRDNLNFAVGLQSRIQSKYPALMRPINLRQQRFNEQMRTGSMILEVGSSGNTLPEAISAAKLFAGVLADELLGA